MIEQPRGNGASACLRTHMTAGMSLAPRPKRRNGDPLGASTPQPGMARRASLCCGALATPREAPGVQGCGPLVASPSQRRTLRPEGEAAGDGQARGRDDRALCVRPSGDGPVLHCAPLGRGGGGHRGGHRRASNGFVSIQTATGGEGAGRQGSGSGSGSGAGHPDLRKDRDRHHDPHPQTGSPVDATRRRVGPRPWRTPFPHPGRFPRPPHLTRGVRTASRRCSGSVGARVPERFSGKGGPEDPGGFGDSLSRDFKEELARS